MKNLSNFTNPNNTGHIVTNELSIFYNTMKVLNDWLLLYDANGKNNATVYIREFACVSYPLE